jgi:plastocyanin
MTPTIRFAFIVAALAIASSCGGSSSPTSPSTGNNTGTNTGTPVSIVSGARTLTTTAYNPNPVTITAGTTVTWTNMDSTTHSATSDSGTFNGTVGPNQQFSFTFTSKGTFTYHCSLHPNMVATVVVQ